MGEIQMVAYNTQTGMFLKKKNNNWTVTEDFSSASGFGKREMQLAVTRAKKAYPGDWMIVRRQDVGKLLRMPQNASASLAELNEAENEEQPVFPTVLPGIQHPTKVDIVHECPRSEGSEEILSLMNRLEAATSANRLLELQAQVGEYDKMVMEIYHWFEANQLNASQGYKAYKNLRKVLLKRRAIKNELHIVQKFRNGKLPDAAQIESSASRLWSPNIDALMKE